jgi:hypothetical protein
MPVSSFDRAAQVEAPASSASRMPHRASPGNAKGPVGGTGDRTAAGPRNRTSAPGSTPSASRRRRGPACDQPDLQRSHPGDGAHCAGPQAAPQPPPLARGSRSHQVLPHGPSRTRAAQVSPASRRGPRPAGLPCEKVLAAVLRLMDGTLIRIGNEEHARQNRSHGLTTLWHEHVQTDGQQRSGSFRAKSGKQQRVRLSDPRLAAVVHACHELPALPALIRAPRTEASRSSSARTPLRVHPPCGVGGRASPEHVMSQRRGRASVGCQ